MLCKFEKRGKKVHTSKRLKKGGMHHEKSNSGG